MKTLFASLAFLICHTASVCAQLASQLPQAPQVTAAKSSKNGHTIRLSSDTIFISIRDGEPHFVVENINKSLDETHISLFLNAFYESSKAKRTNDIVVRSKTKRLVPGESKIKKLMDELRRKHSINVVYFPSPTGSNADAAIQDFARRYLK